jgi:hypothetical protein
MSNHKNVKIKDDDIIMTVTDPPININLFYQFLNNVQRGIDDSIRIIQYTFEGIPLVKYLFFDGDTITLINDTRDSTYEYDKKEINKYTGDSIIRKLKNSIISYYLISNGSNKMILQIPDFLLES